MYHQAVVSGRSYSWSPCRFGHRQPQVRIRTMTRRFSVLIEIYFRTPKGHSTKNVPDRKPSEAVLRHSTYSRLLLPRLGCVPLFTQTSSNATKLALSLATPTPVPASKRTGCLPRLFGADLPNRKKLGPSLQAVEFLRFLKSTDGTRGYASKSQSQRISAEESAREGEWRDGTDMVRYA